MSGCRPQGAASGFCQPGEGYLMSQSVSVPAFNELTTLQKSERMPVLFLGHGSPMNAIENNEYRRKWQALGAEFGKQRPRPQLILCISAHWLTTGWHVTAMAQP